MKKTILIETLLLVLCFAGIVYSVFAASFVVGIVSILSFVAVLATTLKETV